MKRKLISCFLAVCMIAGVVSLPAAVSAAAVETTLAELRYDAASQTAVRRNVDLKDETAAYDSEAGGWKISVTGSQPSPKAFAALMTEDGAGVSGQTVIYEIEMTTKDAGTNRSFQAFYPGGKNMTILKTNPSGDCFLLSEEKNDLYHFKPTNGNRYQFVFTFDLANQKGQVRVNDLTAGTVACDTPQKELPFDALVKVKHEFTPKTTDGEKLTYLHSLRAYTQTDGGIEINTDAFGILPVCAGEDVSVPVTTSGEAPERVELLDGGAVVDSSSAEPFTCTLPSAAAGAHSLTVRACYPGGGSVESEAVLLDVLNMTRASLYVNDFNDQDLKSAAKNGKTDFVERAAKDYAFQLTSYESEGKKNASHFAKSFSPGLTPENTGRFELSVDMIPGEKGTQRGLEIKFEDGKTLEDLILFRFKPDGSWAFANGRKNAQYKPDSVYHIAMAIDLTENKYDCQLKEDGVVLYTDHGLQLASKSEAKGKPVTRLKIQQNEELVPSSCMIDNLEIYSYEEIREVTIVETHQMQSPDGKVTGAFLLDSEGGVLYQAEYGGTPVIQNSALGLRLSDGAGGFLKDGFTLDCDAPVTVEGSWEPLYGTKSEYPENYTEYVYHLTEAAAPLRSLDVIFRLYNEGIAFRYRIPEQGPLSGAYQILAETTEFSIPGNPEVWYQTQTETIPYQRTLDSMGTVNQIRRPMTLLYEDGTGAAIVESDMYGYARMHMNKTGGSGVFRAALASEVQVEAGGGEKLSPWRAMILGGSSGEVLERGYLVENLAPAPSGPEYSDVSWITPGKAVRVANGFSYDNACKHVDFAVDRNIQYIMFDGGWYGVESSSDADPRYPVNDTVTGKPMDMKAICDYAHSKGIKVVVYINNRAIFEEYLYSKNGRPEPRYTTEELLQYLSGWGIDGLKPGFVDCDTQTAEKWNLDLARLAAKYHMTVNTHDLYVPAGVNRTYPNFVGAEGIWGDEHSDITAARDLTHFFTRYVQGPADHTWCWYNYRVSKAFRLASAVLSYTPQQYQFWYEGPQNYTQADARELQFWKDVPAVWDDTRVLEGEIGKYLTVARRSGSDWFIGSGSAVTRTLSIPLDFLGDGKYIAEIYQNGPDDYFDISIADPSNPVSAKTVNGKKDTVATEKRLADQNTVLTAQMKDSFGYAVRLTPATPEELAKLSYVEITSPQNGAALEPGDVKLEVSVGEGVQRVEYYSDGQLIGAAQTAPYSLVYPNPGEGMYSLTAKAYYENGTVAVTGEPVVIGLSRMKEGKILDLDFNNGNYSGLDITTTAKEIVPKRAGNPEDLAIKLTTAAADRAYQVNYVPSPVLSSENEKKIRFQADFLFEDNQTTRGLFELRRVSKAGQQDNPILVSLSGGNISVRGASGTVPYAADKEYNIKIVIDMKTWLYDCTITEDGRTILEETSLSMGSADFVRIERVKCQQEIAGGGLETSVMYIDNYQVYRAIAPPEVAELIFTDGEGTASTNPPAAPVDTTKVKAVFGVSMTAASFQDHVRLVKMPEGTPVAFEGKYSGGYEMTLREALLPDTAYRIYFDGVTDSNQVSAVKGYFKSFRTEQEAFSLDSFLCMKADGSFCQSMGALKKGERFTVIPSVRNESGERKRFTVIAAVYSKDGGLRCGAAETFTLEAGETLKNASLPVTAYDGISAEDRLEVYVWDGLRSMRPMSMPKSI